MTKKRSGLWQYPVPKPLPRHSDALDSIVDIVLAYKPKAKSKPARRRKRQATKIAKGTK